MFFFRLNKNARPLQWRHTFVRSRFVAASKWTYLSRLSDPLLPDLYPEKYVLNSPLAVVGYATRASSSLGARFLQYSDHVTRMTCDVRRDVSAVQYSS